jgi:hypothetical protein
MRSEELLKRAHEILEESSCWNGIENEVIKLSCLFSRCATSKHEGQEWVNIDYVREKIFNLLIKHPTLLSDDAKKIYASMRIEKELSEIKMKSSKERIDEGKIIISEECPRPISFELNLKGSEGFETVAQEDGSILVRPKWISVKDKLPAKENHYIVCLINGCPILCCVHDSNFCITEGQLSFYWPNQKWVRDKYYAEVTHWMPLPADEV